MPERSIQNHHLNCKKGHEPCIVNIQARLSGVDSCSLEIQCSFGQASKATSCEELPASQPSQPASTQKSNITTETRFGSHSPCLLRDVTKSTSSRSSTRPSPMPAVQLHGASSAFNFKHPRFTVPPQTRPTGRGRAPSLSCCRDETNSCHSEIQKLLIILMCRFLKPQAQVHATVADVQLEQ